MSHTTAKSIANQLADLSQVSRNRYYFSAILLFIPLIFHRLFIGTSEGFYEGLQLSAIGYVAHICLIIMPFLVPHGRKIGVSLLFLVALYLISIFQLYNTYYIFLFNDFGLLFAGIRALLWITAIYIYCACYYEPDHLLKAFIDIMTAAGLFAVFCYLVYLTTNIPIGINIDRDVGRLQGMFSEPSTLSAIYPAYVLINFHLKDYKRMALGIAVVILSFSVICLAIMTISIFIYIIHKRKRLLSAASYGVTTLIVLITFSAGSGVEESAYRLSESLRSFVDLFWSPGPVRQNTVDRLIDALAAMSTYVTSGQRLEVGDSGSLARIVGSFFLVENMIRDGTTWTGYGLSNYGYVADQLYGNVLDFGFFPYLVSSFGMAAGIAMVFLHLHRILKWNGINAPLFFMFICGYFGTIYNSAGGITAYTLPVLGFMAGYAEDKRRSRLGA